MNTDCDLLLVENALWVLSAPIGMSFYDFNFRAYFPCRTPWCRDAEVTAVARLGALDDYRGTFLQLAADRIRLIHTPEEHLRSSELPGWYPLIQEMTPRSRSFPERPSAREVSQEFEWPVFVKGIRQTSRHRRSISIIQSAEHFDAAMEEYQSDAILHWQPIAVREFVPLRCVEDSEPSRIPASFEFRTFWWRGRLVGAGRYWWEGRPYDWNADERRAALAIAEEAARRVAVPFLVLDLAMTAAGHWIVIECNDGQESGYAGVSPLGLWQSIIRLEQELGANVNAAEHRSMRETTGL